jgi:hypothetical protein
MAVANTRRLAGIEPRVAEPTSATEAAS